MPLQSRRLFSCLCILLLAACGGESSDLSSHSTSRGSLVQDDYGDVPWEATPVDPHAGPIVGALDFDGDHDVFSFTAQAGRYYRFQCLFSGPLSEWTLRRFDAQMQGAETEGVWAPPGMGIHFKVAVTEPTYLSISSRPAVTVSPYSCEIVELGLDDHGDLAATATPWNPATAATGVLEYVFDRDVFSLSLPRGAVYRVRCESTTLNPCKVNVTSPVGTATGATVQAAVFNATHPGTYSVEVTPDWYAPLLLNGTYALQLDFLEADDHGDVLEFATPLTPSPTPFTGRVSNARDRDVFTFSAVQDHLYRFTCSAPPSPGLLLRDGAGVAVEGSVHVSGWSTSVSVEAPAAGGYSVELFHDNFVGPYTCALEDLGLDDHGDSAGVATAIAFPTTLDGHLETRGDVDVFTFPVQAGRIYRFLRTSGTGSSQALQLRNAQGQSLQTSNSGHLIHEATEDAQYTLEVKLDPGGIRYPGTYVIEATDMGPDDHANTQVGATVLVPGQTATGWRHREQDRDVFVFHAQDQTLYILYCTVCDLTFETPNGPARRIHHGGPTRFFFDPVEAGPIYVTVNQAFVGAFYDLRLEVAAVDDHGDDVAHATVITFPSSFMAALDSFYDVDVFAADLVAGQPRRVQVLGAYSMFQVLDPMGQPVAVNSVGEFTPQLSGSHHVVVKVDPWYAYQSGAFRLTLD
ncbi:hypothetical protein [Myxococcus sp. CA040A]|uniref:hypothetical protein n=1 Tax=Myxococcus sp. CA040A TaxID=2741738 RepID=UPI00157ADB93|nr:hypothetical protein [Myxococcus sp. CA040A]NTX01733.1 hypothetical protein [Myxococcus sp. CA040A]